MTPAPRPRPRLNRTVHLLAWNRRSLCGKGKRSDTTPIRDHVTCSGCKDRLTIIADWLTSTSTHRLTPNHSPGISGMYLIAKPQG
jgi:hypothetical protein